MKTRHLEIILASMQDPGAAEIEQGVMEAIQMASRRPVEPTLESELVADLGFDSLQVLDVIAEIEGRFDIVVPLDAVPATRTVAQVVAEVTRLVRARGNG
jgi:acyl carrier protein